MLSLSSHRPEISVIIPAFNAGPFIGAAIHSVLRQTYQDFEVLVIDDGSTDSTAAFAQSIGSRVRYIYQANSGPSAARNTGIWCSVGECVAFLDADDVWMPEFLETQLHVLRARPDVDVVIAWAQFADEGGALLADSFRSSLDGLTLRRLLLGGDSVLLSTMLARRNAFEAAGFFDPALRQAEDWDIVLRMVAAGIRFACTSRVLVYRRVHAASVTANPEDALHWERVALQKALSTLPLPPECKALGPAGSFRILQRAAMGHWRQGARATAVERLLEGFESWPAAIQRPQTYLGVIYRLQPSGWRSDEVILQNLDRLADESAQVLREMFGHRNLPETIRTKERRAWSALHAVLALLFLKKGHWRSALRHAFHSIWTHPLPLLKGAATKVYQAAALRRRK